MNRKFCISFLVLMFLISNAQHSLRFKRINVNNGLSQNTVIMIAQDRNGFMWMATQDGLNRYDGYSFKIYRHAENDSTSLSNNYVMSLAADKYGNIWAGTTNGLNKIDGATGQLKRINLKGILKDASNFRIHSICVAENGNVYFAMGWGIFYADTLGRIHPLEKYNKDKRGAVELFIRNDKLWIGAQNKIFCYDFDSENVEELPIALQNMALLQVKDSSLLIRSNELLYSYDNLNKKVSNVYAKYFNSGVTRHCISVFGDNNGTWLSTVNGLIWQRGNDTLLIKHFEDYEFSLSSDYVYCVFKDRLGLYWIGTSRGGLCVFDPDWQNFKILGKPFGLNASVWNATEKNDTLFLGTTKGLKIYKKNRPGARISDYFLPEQILTEIQIPTLQENVKDLLITSVTTDVRGNLWMGTERNGVCYYDFHKKRSQRFLKSESDSASLCSDGVLGLSTLSDTTVGVCSSLGFSIINTKNLRVKRIYLTLLNKTFTNNYILKSLAEDDKIWLSSANGLCRINTKANTLDQFLPDAKNIAEQYHNIVSDIKIDKQGRHWVSTLGYGVLDLDVSTGNFTRYSTNRGLKNETILGILVDERSNLWLGTHEGISKFDAKIKYFETYGVREGLDSKECTINGFYKSKNGDLFFGTVSGLVIFNPESVKPDTGSCGTILTSIKINYNNIENSVRYISCGSIFRPQVLNLDHTDKTVAFEFAAINFMNSENVSYKYKLWGFNDAWVKVNGAERTAIYTNLPPNTYTFTVIPLVNNKEEMRSALSFVVKVSPPFWKAWWFILLSVLTTVLLIGFIVRYYSQKKLKDQLRRAEEEGKLQREKERISRELHDNVGSQLTYIIKSLDNLSYKSGNDTFKVAQHLDALGDFSRETLNQLRESIWAINSKVIPMSELLTKVHEYINKINSSFEQIVIKLETTYEVNSELKPTLAINCFRVLQEAVTNSLKYSEAKIIEIHIVQKNQHELSFKISDNGKGFDTTNGKGKGYGLENMRIRVNELGAAFDLKSSPGKGTVINFTIKTE